MLIEEILSRRPAKNGDSISIIFWHIFAVTASNANNLDKRGVSIKRVCVYLSTYLYCLPQHHHHQLSTTNSDTHTELQTKIETFSYCRETQKSINRYGLQTSLIEDY